MSDNEQESLADALSAEFDKQTVEPEAVEEVQASEPDEKEEVQVEGESGTEVAEVAPPEHWSDEDKDAFMKMDDAGRDWALRLSSNYDKGIQEKSEELKKFRGAIEPYKHLIPAGVDETAVIQNLLSAQSYLQRDPVEGVKWLMRNLGVDEKQFSKTDEGKDDDPYVDPEIRSLKDEIRGLKDGAEQRARLAEQERQKAFLAEVNQFREETDDSGELLHPHFNDVQGVMAGLLQSGRAEDMATAYEQAVWAIPEYRDSVVEQKAKERAAEELKRKAEEAEAAKKKATTVQGKSSAKKATKEQSLTDSLSEAYEKSVRGEL